MGSEMDKGFTSIFYSVICGFLIIVLTVSICTGVHWRNKYISASRAAEFNQTEIGRLEEELGRSREAVEEYESRLRDSIEVITRARSTSGRTEDLLRDSIEIIDELTAILFPVEQTERNLESCGNNRYNCLSAADLYNYSCFNIEEVKEE